MICADAVAVGAHDFREPLVLGRQLRRLAEQLRGVAHGAHGIADLVRDARGQPAERRELRLLDLGREQLGVFEEHDDRRGFRAAERREMRLDHVAAVGRDERVRRRRRAWPCAARQVSSR